MKTLNELIEGYKDQLKGHLVLIFSFMMCLMLPIYALANSAEPPSFTVIVIKPPTDLSLTLQFPDGMQTEPLVLSKEEKAWEAYYRFFYHSYPGGEKSLEGSVLIVKYDGDRFQCDLPSESFNTYNNLLTLDISTQTIAMGQPAWRIPTLIALRIFLTLLIEGFVFFLFGYRKKESWLAFAAINLVTQGTLNGLLTGPQIGGYWLLGFLFGEVIVFAVEIIAFAFIMREFGKRRAISYAVVANTISLIVGGVLISYLPI
jgi:hypothetical protein